MRLSFFPQRSLYFLRKTIGCRMPRIFFSSKVLLGEDTIFALSSGHGKAGVAVIRVSGPSARDVLDKLGAGNKLPSPRQASLRKICDPDTQEQIDRGLVLWFPGITRAYHWDFSSFFWHALCCCCCFFYYYLFILFWGGGR